MLPQTEFNKQMLKNLINRTFLTLFIHYLEQVSGKLNKQQRDLNETQGPGSELGSGDGFVA